MLISFTTCVIVTAVTFALFPMNYDNEFPEYPFQSLYGFEIAGAFVILGCTVMAIKLADERQVLP